LNCRDEKARPEGYDQIEGTGITSVEEMRRFLSPRPGDVTNPGAAKTNWESVRSSFEAVWLAAHSLPRRNSTRTSMPMGYSVDLPIRYDVNSQLCVNDDKSRLALAGRRSDIATRQRVKPITT
jgi:hypothetical protein